MKLRMRWLPKSCLLILIASVLLLSATSSGSDATPSNHPHTEQAPDDLKHTPAASRATVGNQVSPTPTSNQSAAYTYNYYSQAPEPCLTFFGQIAQIVFTFALVVVGYKQWRTYEAQRAIQHQQKILSHGPKLRFRELVLVRGIQVNEPIEVALSLINIGNDTAKIISGNFTVDITRPDIVPWREKLDNIPTILEPYKGSHGFKFGKEDTLEAGIQTLPASQKYNNGFGCNPEDWQGIADGTKALWAFGYVFYEDVELRLKHKTGFCRRFDLATKRFCKVDDPELEYEF